MTKDAEKYSILMCFHCGNKTMMKEIVHHRHMEEEALDEDEFGNPTYVLYWEQNWHLFSCPVCNNVTLKKVSWFSEDIDHMGRPIPTEEILYPPTTRKSANMPDKVFGAFESAIKVRHIDGAICALSLRRTLEMMCKDLGATEGDLYLKLQSLSQRGVLPPILGEMATVLRKLGNDAAHADDAEFPKDVVEAMIDFTQTILEYVYRLPQALEDIQDRISKPRKKREETELEESLDSSPANQ
jgi:signal recognition particle subunit SEC65